MSQPSYFCIANLGDVNPFEHGGAFVCIDRRGVYDPILLIYDQDFRRRSEVTLERCHKIPDVSNFLWEVGTNRFHPKHVEWFSDSLENCFQFNGSKISEIVNKLTSSNVVERAIAYKMLVDYHGIHEFDQHPYNFHNEGSAREFCAKMLEQLKESKTWHDGYFHRDV